MRKIPEESAEARNLARHIERLEKRRAEVKKAREGKAKPDTRIRASEPELIKLIKELERKGDTLGMLAAEHVLDNVRRFDGLITPPKAVVKVMIDAVYPAVRKLCIHCDKIKSGMEFGPRLIKSGKIDIHSWCNACRSGKDAHPGRFNN